MQRVHRTALLGAALALLVGAPVASARPAIDSSVLADRDGDRILDDLERRLAIGSGPVSVIVTLRAAATPERVAELRQRVGGFAVTRRFGLVPSFVATMNEAQVRALASSPHVVHVEENAAVQAAIDSAQESFGVAKARADAGVDGDGDGAPGTYSKDDLVAAVVDSGIATSHRDLDEGKVIGWADLVNGLPEPYDDYGHGTAVASVLAGEGDARPDRLYRGVAPGAALVGVKVLDRQGRGTVADVIAGVEWVVAMKDAYGIEAVNLSLEQPGCSNGADALSLAVNAAYDAGLVVVVAAGNSGPGTCTIGSPGAAANAITVGAMADLGASGFKQAAFSSRGPTLDGRVKPDISAPGVAMTSAASGTFAGYAVQSGTSLAAPFVSGLALLMLDANPTLGAPAVAAAFRNTAVDWGRGGDGTTKGSHGPDIDYGAGRLDGYAAMEAAAGHDLGSAPSAPAHVLLEGNLAGAGDAVDFQLEIVDASVPVAATLILPSVSGGQSSNPDFDLALLDPGGVQVASATTSKRQDELGYAPGFPGRYVLRVRSQAGGGGFFADVSAGLPVVAAEAPSVVELPTVAGVARRGSALVSTIGVWSGTLPLAFARQWQRCGESGEPCVDIVGAVASTYVVGKADVGARLRLVVEAANEAGTAEAVSAATATVKPGGPRIAAASVGVSRHRLTFRARTLRCDPCRMRAVIKVRGRWVGVAMSRAGSVGLARTRWSATLPGVPTGRWLWRIRALDLDEGLTARSALRLVAVPGA